MNAFRLGEPLVLRQVPQTEDYRSPFKRNVPGFKEHWWERDWGPVGDKSSSAFVSLEYGEEVARVMTDPNARLYHRQYFGLQRLVDPVEVLRFEVRVDLYGRGIGRRAVRRLAHHYRGRDLYAFGDAEGFWRAIGWREYPRADSESLHVPLFVLRQA